MVVAPLRETSTELMYAKLKRRPVKILFHPSSNQEILDDCGDQIQLVRRNSQSVFGCQFLKTGELVKIYIFSSHMLKVIITITGNTSERDTVLLQANRSTVLSFDERDVGKTLEVELAIYNTKVVTAVKLVKYVA